MGPTRIPDSPRLSDVSDFDFGSPPKLDPSTLALLDDFLASKAEEERRFQALAEERAAAELAGLKLAQVVIKEKPMISVQEFKTTFGEDWQLSQFWYSETFANALAKEIHALCTPSSKVAFASCPTAFVAFQHMNPLDGARLFEIDQRFAIIAPTQFVPYDMDEPDVFPEEFKAHFDIIVTDPPFLNEPTHRKIVQTLQQIIKPGGKLIMLTSDTMEKIINKIYTEPPLGPMRKTAFDVEHGQLANEFAAWGSWAGAENFGKDSSTV